MSQYWDIFTKQFQDGWIWKHPELLTGPGQFNFWYNNAHGGFKRGLAEIPIYGWSRKLLDAMNYAQDYYSNTGEDPLYMSKYGSAAGSVGGALNGAIGVIKMSRSLASLYPAEVKEDLSNNWKEAWRMKRESYMASERAANAWGAAWQNKR